MTAKSTTSGVDSGVHYLNREKKVKAMETADYKIAQLQAGITKVSLVGKSWHYRGEGCANLVISLPAEKRVIRFSKSKYPSKNHNSRILEIAYYANYVMSHSLGKHYVRSTEIGRVTKSDFDHVRSEAEIFRPKERCNKSIISHNVILSPDCAFLTPEYEKNTVGDTYSFEIKPKQGWHSEKASCTSNLCTRCLKQYAKLYKGEQESISHYCPLDLFSGDDLRMKRAIFDLFQSPHNRFKIAKNGNLIYTETEGFASSIEKELQDWLAPGSNLDPGKGVDLLAGLLCTALLANLDPGSGNLRWNVREKHINLKMDNSGQARRTKYGCDTSHEELPRGCILDKILELQRHTDISDHEAKLLCDKYITGLEKLHRLTIWHPLTVEHLRAKSLRELEHQGLSRTEIENLQQLQRFLLSVTAKDVSILITLRKIKDGLAEHELHLPSVTIPVGGTSFRLMVSVIDLDPKPIHRLSTWIKKKEDWLRIYQETLDPATRPLESDIPKCEELVAV